MFFFRFYVCVEILAFYPIMCYFQVFSFLRSGEKVDCKKWYEGKKSFIKIESLEVVYVYL